MKFKNTITKKNSVFKTFLHGFINFNTFEKKLLRQLD